MGFELCGSQTHTAWKPMGMQMESNQQIATREGMHRMHDGQIEIQIQAGVPWSKKSRKQGITIKK